MPQSNGSLILKEQSDLESTPFLFSKEELPKVDETKPVWHCTGEYLFNNRPDVYKAVVDMLVEPGISIRLICRTLRVSHNTVSSIQEREAPNLDTRKKVILSTVTRGLRLCAERVEELAPDMGARDALVGVGILGEKMQLLGGDPTIRIELKPRVDFRAEFEKLHAEAERRFAELKRAGVIDVAWESPFVTGLNGRNLAQKALNDFSDASEAAEAVMSEPEA